MNEARAILDAIFDVISKSEYVKFALITGLVCITLIFIWLLLRRFNLWYWKTENMLHSMDTVSYRLEYMENYLGRIEEDTLKLTDSISSPIICTKDKTEILPLKQKKARKVILPIAHYDAGSVRNRRDLMAERAANYLNIENHEKDINDDEENERSIRNKIKI